MGLLDLVSMVTLAGSAPTHHSPPSVLAASSACVRASFVEAFSVEAKVPLSPAHR